MDEERESGSPESALLEIITSSWKSQAISVCCQIGIADRLAAGPGTAEELAADLDCHAPSLQRLMRALVSLDILEDVGRDGFALTDAGRCLRTDAPDSVRAWAIWWGKYLWPTWERLDYSVRTGEPARKLVSGAEGFGQLEANAEMDAVFKQAMNDLTRRVGEALVRAYDFTGIRKIVDIGGGHGELLKAILDACPEATGVLLDVPHTMDGARQYLRGEGLDGRCECVGGDFFESVPGGADAYVLKSVLHNWDDEHCARILDNCRRAMPAHSRLLVLEQMLPEEIDTSARDQSILLSDITMLLAHGGRERRIDELEALLGGQGLRVAQLMPMGASYTLIEAVPV